jgi:hypothetical protein
MRINNKTMDYATRQAVRAITISESVCIKQFKQNPTYDFSRYNEKITNNLYDINHGFTAYVWSFYGIGGVYGEFFKENPITVDEVIKTEKQLRKMIGNNFEGDSIDRERMRDLMMINRKAINIEECEYKMTK